MTIDELITRLRRPLYVYTMAQRDPQFDTPQTRSAKTRRKNAEFEIDDLVLRYAKERHKDDHS